MDKKVLDISMVLITLFLIGFISGCAEKKPAELEKVTFRMNWIPYGEHAPVWVAKDKGFYAEEGLDVEVIYGKGSTLSAQLVGSGDNDFAMCSGDTALMSKVKGLPIKVLAVMIQKSPVCVRYFEKTDIKVPKDLEGKRIGLNVQSTKYNQYKAFAKINNVDTSKIEEVPLEAGTEMPAMIAGKVDAFLHYSFEMPRVPVDEAWTDMLFEDYGVHVYSSSLITNEKLLEENPDLVKRFTRATVKGWKYATEHPEEAMEIFVKHHPELNYENELQTLKGMIPLMESESTKEHGMGYQSKATWEYMQDFLFDLDLIDHKINVDKVFTNEYLD